MHQSRSQYPGLLAISNVILLIASTILMYLGASLVTFYHLDKLDFVSRYFSIVPYCMICLGVGSFIVALYGTAVGMLYSRFHLLTYSTLMIGLFVVQLAGIFFAMELRAVINAGEYSGVDILSDLEYYNESPSTRSKWDALQREFKCCGGVNFNDGYKIWRNSDVGLTSNGVPDSCCLRPDPGCGRNIFAEQDSALNRLIHTHGCLTILSDKLLEQVVPVLVGYAGVGVVLALIQLLAVVFACSFSAQISREMYQDDARSLGRTSTYHGGVDHIIHHHQQHTLSMQGTPKAERVLGYSGVQHDDMNNKVFVADAEDRYSRKFMDSPTSELDERPV